MNAALSVREKDVIGRVGQGLTNQQIATELSLSVNTVKAHLQRIYRKLGASNRAQASQRFSFWNEWTRQHSAALLSVCPTCRRSMSER